MIGDGVESMLLCELFEDVESNRRRGGEPIEENEEFRVYFACRKRPGLSCLGDVVVRDFSGDRDRCRCGITKDGESLSLRIEKTRSRGCVRTSIVGRSKRATSGEFAGTTLSESKQSV